MSATFQLISTSLKPAVRPKIKNITYVYVDEPDTDTKETNVTGVTIVTKPPYIPKTKRVEQYGMHIITAWVTACIVIFIPYHFISDLMMKRKEEKDRQKKNLGVIEVLPAEGSRIILNRVPETAIVTQIMEES